MKQKPVKRCYLCGVQIRKYKLVPGEEPPPDHQTRDHIPPEKFFPQPLPLNLLTVPCCTRCNNGFSHLDEQMRVFFAAEEHANDAAKLIASQKIFTENSVKGKQFRTVASSLKTFPVKIGNTITLGNTLSVSTVDLFRFVERIIRGLVHKFYPDLRDPKAAVCVECISTVAFKDAKNAVKTDEIMDKLCELAPQMQRTCFGDGVLDFLHGRADAGACFIISFYRGATFMATYALKAPIPV